MQPVRSAIYTEKQELLFNELRQLGIEERIVEAFRRVPRDRFVPVAFSARAFENSALPIACGQTISQPYTVALMTQLLSVKVGHRVLEIGTGSGFQAAVLCALGADLITIERFPELSAVAAENLANAGFQAHCLIGDGSTGAPEYAPFDRIIVTAASPNIPSALVAQLVEGGTLVIPIGNRKEQRLTVGIKRGSRLQTQDYGSARFVPLVGEQGWENE